MLLIDANAILRYMLNDNADMAGKVHDIMENSAVSVRYEVLAEVVYVLSKVYSLPKTELVEGIKVFLSYPNVEIESEGVIASALSIYAKTTMDFVDCVLYSFKAVYGHGVFTFDKQLNSMMAKLS